MNKDLTNKNEIINFFYNILVKEWEKSKNINCLVFYLYLKTNYNFFSLKKTIKKPLIKNSLFNLIVSRVMTHKGMSGGKKEKIQKTLLDQLLKSNTQLQIMEKLCKAIINTVPNKNVRHIKYGSGSISRVVTLTINKKISWFVKQLVKNIKGNFSEEIKLRISQAAANNSKSKLHLSKNEIYKMVDSAQIQ